MIAIGTKVTWAYPGEERTTGTIVDYNRNEGGLLNKDRYPYVIRWDNDGYRDVYGRHDFLVEGEKPAPEFRYIRREGHGFRNPFNKSLASVDFVVPAEGCAWGKAIGATQARTSMNGYWLSHPEQQELKRIRDEYFPGAQIKAWVRGQWFVVS